ncbi:uncharacterized protein LOC131874284 [Cryptomeria japonica]|uniref:uncharacterized protein LOC131874284 n=1 Tax=Cryptomeria japonica TaxID=3369 RepID=UPI0027DA97B4|nr:uncharacterized protein LOC131874284 [Cryptomeria japonica]
MKILSWNVGGMNAPNKQRIIKRCLSESKPNIILIQETKMNSSEIDLFEKKLGFRKLKHSPALGALGGSTIIWDPRFSSFSPSEIKHNWIGGKNEICIIGGDFNTITKALDKREGSNKLPSAALDFNDWINRNSLLEIQTAENTLTWNNRRKGFSDIADKLDSFFIHGGLKEFNYTMEAEILPLSGFDHYPLQLNILIEQGPQNCPFKFKSMWFKDDNIINLIEQWWSESVFSGSKMFTVTNKFKLIKRTLLEWNREHFGNIFDKKLLVEMDLKDVNKEVLDRGMDEPLFLKEKL